MTFGRSVMTRNGLAESLGSIHSRAVYQKRMKEYRVTFFHTQVELRMGIKPLNSVVHGVHTTLPVRIVMLVQYSRIVMTSWQNKQTAVVLCNTLHCCPRGNDTISRPVREIVQILV
uniref:Uncharacterized protein n=1 Tax=Cacopsylla melanoneura TaxID=428564 RepID=A0A8D8SAE6_9HEMI